MSKGNAEEKLTVIASIIAMVALVVSLVVKGFTIDNIMDTVFNASATLVTIAVFLIARRVYLLSQGDFAKEFEKHLAKWAQENTYLVSLMDSTRNDTKRAYKMVTNQKNVITRRKKASDIPSSGSAKGDFLILPTKKAITSNSKDIELRFVIVKSFIKKSGLDHEQIKDCFTGNINQDFNELIHGNAKGKVTTKNNENDRVEIVISLNTIDRTSENARKLVDLVEYVKTMILALT